MKIKRSKEPEDVFLYEQIRRARRAVTDLLDAFQKVSRSKNPAVNTRAITGMLKLTEKYLRQLDDFESVVDSDTPSKEKDKG